MSSSWAIMKLGQVLRPAHRPEQLDPSARYDLLGIRLAGKGPFLRETKLGSEIAASTLYRVQAGDIIYSRLFAWRGAFGLVDPNLDGCYVSGEFPTFQPIPDRLDARYLNYWFRLPTTLTRVEADCTGSTPLTRNRFKENFFLALEIPLPSLHEQGRIVARIEELAGKLEEARGLQKAIATGSYGILHSVYERITQGVDWLLMQKVAPLVRRPVQVDLVEDYPELGIRSFGKGTFHKAPVSGAALGSKRIFRIEPGDLLFNIVFAWDGAVAVARPEDQGRVGSHRFLTCVPKAEVATSSFLRFHFLTEQGLEQLGKASPGGAGRNRTLGLEALENIPVPVPPIETQKWFDSIQAQVDALKQLQAESTAEFDALLPSILEKAFKAELG